MTHSSGKSLVLITCSAALIGGALAGCSSSGGSSDKKLSKADFVTQANAACASTLAKVKAAPTPTGPTDYTAIHQYVSIGLNEEPAFLRTVTALADRTADKAELHKKWLDPESAAFAQQKPVVEKLDTAAQAKNAAQVTSLIGQLSSLDSPDDSDFLTSYGLTQCEALNNYGSN